MRRTNPIVGMSAAVALAAAASGYLWHSAPARTLAAVAAAAKSDDAVAFDKHVNYPKVQKFVEQSVYEAMSEQLDQLNKTHLTDEEATLLNSVSSAMTKKFSAPNAVRERFVVKPVDYRLFLKVAEPGRWFVYAGNPAKESEADLVAVLEKEGLLSVKVVGVTLPSASPSETP